MRQTLTRIIRNPARFGIVTGLLFGLWNLGAALLYPLAEDSVTALLSFYGPMFFMPSVAAFAVFRSASRWRDAIKAAVIVGVISQLIFGALNLIRVNLLLETLAQRSDWQFLVASYQTGSSESFRTFVNFHYAQQTVPKLAAVTVIATVCGILGAALATLLRRPASSAAR